MARRKKGRDFHGWLLIDKPAGMTSSHVVNKLKYAFDANKVGHGGTLDPDATGLLPIAFGEATKLLPYLEDAYKTYEFQINWGAQTRTDDAAGEIIAQSDLRPDRLSIELALEKFRGDILQIPPQVSAVKVDGVRAYDLAREGVEMELKSRPLFVASLELIACQTDHAVLRMICGKGGYVRSIARDLGTQIGCLGHIDHLRRLACLGFSVDNALTLTQILNGPRDELVINISATPLISRIEVSPSEAIDLGHGRELLSGNRPKGVAMAICGNLPIAMVEVTNASIEVRRGLHL